MTTDIESPTETRSSSEVPWDEAPCLKASHASRLRASLKGLATLCRENATAHGKAAKVQAGRHNILQIASIAVSSSTTICAAVSLSDNTWAGQLETAILAAAASAVQAIIGLYNPQAKREKHGATEHRYTCLSRDIVVKLVSGSDDAAYWEDVLKDCQRALDNIQAVAPEL
jgi:hypothetical protein